MIQLTHNVDIRKSDFLDTNTGIVSGPHGLILIDPGVWPHELADLAGIRKNIAAGFTTHAHWDHLLWHQAFGSDTPRYASAETVALAHLHREDIVRDLVEMQAYTPTDEHWDQSVLFTEQPMPWGTRQIAGLDVELIPVRGHEDGQAALLVPEERVCFVADTLSDTEVPSFRKGSQSIILYLQSLDRLQQFLPHIDWIVPGHGNPGDAVEAQRRIDADRRYLHHLQSIVRHESAEKSEEEIAQEVLHGLDEHRADEDFAWGMHLGNVEQLIAERDRDQTDLPMRRSSRLIILNYEHHVYMFRSEDPVNPCWVLPGGGLERGETWRQAALRELWEECGINDAEIGPMVATRQRPAEIGGVWHHTEEQYFLVQLQEQTPGTGNLLDYELAEYTKQAWMSAMDIRANPEPSYPTGLADLLDILSDGRTPDAPLEWKD